jgi:hypothetical protein
MSVERAKRYLVGEMLAVVLVRTFIFRWVGVMNREPWRCQGSPISRMKGLNGEIRIEGKFHGELRRIPGPQAQ